MAQAKRSPAKALTFWESLQPLIELYNLHLDFTPCVGVFPPMPLNDADREKMRNYLRRHARHIFLKAPAKMLDMDRESRKTLGYGTLENFLASEGRDWFSSEYAIELCQFWYRLCFLLDLYIDGEFTGKYLHILQALLNEFKPAFMLRDRATRELYSIAAFWDAPLDTQRYEILWGGGIVETGEVLSKYRLDVGDLLAQLTFSLYRIIADDVRVVRCQRKKCSNIFAPKPRAPRMGKAPKYCPSCRSKRKT
jgi:hypothetical protein